MSNPSPVRTALVLPTYNERDNLPALVAAIQALPCPIRIIIVDDGSPDGTGQIADQLAAGSDAIHVIHRSGKLGLGTAYVAGFHRALEDGADLVLTMDADFSHDPRHLPAMLELSRQCDLVIGSRYVPGGGVRLWGAERILLSRTANLLAHRVLGLRARDCTSGFRCYRRQVLERVRPESIRADGYSYLIEMLFQCQQAGFTVGEVPILFVDRRAGRSKISKSEIFKAGLTVLRLSVRRLASARQRVRAKWTLHRPARPA